MKLLSLPLGEADEMVDEVETSLRHFVHAYDDVAFDLDDGNKPSKEKLTALKTATENLDKRLEVFRKETGV